MEITDHKSLIASLSGEERTSLIEKSDASGLFQVGLHFGLILVFSVLIIMGGPLKPLFMLAQGVLIVFLFTALHETVHSTPFKTEALNVWVGRICGFLVFLGPKWFQYFHLAHHRYTHIPGKDPELASPKPVTPWQYLKFLSGIPDLVGRIRGLVCNAVWDNEEVFVPARGRQKVKLEARVYVAGYVSLISFSIIMQSTLLLFLWVIPFVIAGPFLRAYLLAEHARCPHVASMLENTRTTFTNRLIRFLAWNMPYHVEHHAYPSVPFHKLPEFHKYTRQHIVHMENGYARFNKRYLSDSWSNRLEVG